MIAEHRRARAVGRAQQASEVIGKKDRSTDLQRIKTRIDGANARNAASRELMESGSLEDRFAALEREEQIDMLLQNLKEQHAKTA